MNDMSDNTEYTMAHLDPRELFMVAFTRLFSHLTPEETGSILKAAKQKNFAKGNVIIEEGSEDQALFIVVSGEVKITKQEISGTERSSQIEIARLGVGAILGEMSFLEQDRTSAAVVAVDDVELFHVDGREIQSLIEASPQFAGHFYQSLAMILSRRLRVTNTLVTDRGAQSKPENTKSRKFFIVDDDYEICQLVTLLLEQRGHTVLSNVSSIFSISEIVSFRPDCVITDFMMPEMDGMELCRELRSRPELRRTKIVMLSRWSEENWAAQATASGANGFICKPIDPHKLGAQVENIVEAA